MVAIILTTGRNNRGGLDAIPRRLYFESFDAPETFRRKRNVTKSADDDDARRVEAPWKSLSNVIVVIYSFRADVIHRRNVYDQCAVYACVHLIIIMYNKT